MYVHISGVALENIIAMTGLAPFTTKSDVTKGLKSRDNADHLSLFVLVRRGAIPPSQPFSHIRLSRKKKTPMTESKSAL
jgi:hypothetical protein